MASCPFPFPTTVNQRNHHRAPPTNYNFPASKTIDSVTFTSSSSTINLHRSFPLNLNFRLGRCGASSSPSEPPSEKDMDPASDATPKDKLQIFFAVLFWMSLFFWSCIWDGGNSGKSNKGTRFRK